MFCDIVGSTALARQVDPEEWREIVQQYHVLTSKAVALYEGYIAQLLGDGVLVYFGYPVAHEQEAERATRAGLEILARIRELSKKLKAEHDLELKVRIGIHTGLTVVGAMGGGDRREHLALGDTPNVAARLQGIAGPGTLVVSEATYRLIVGSFICENLGPKTLKGIPTAEPVYRVVRERDMDSVLDLRSENRLYRPIGRDDELELLLQRWDRVKQGEGQVVTVCGEAGIGKSYLVQSFRTQHETHDYTHLECRCSPYHENSAFHPVIELLGRVLNFYQGETNEERLDMIGYVAERNGFHVKEAVPILASMFAIPLDGRFDTLSLSPKNLKEKTLSLLVRLFVQMAEERPMIFLFEDIHWADPSTHELIARLVEQQPGTRMMLLLAYRPSYIPPWRSHHSVTQINLSRLSYEKVESMIWGLTEGKILPEPVLRQILVKTDGVPLFVEELTKMVLESGLLRDEGDHYELPGPLPPLAIPATLHDSLMARLDRLATVKEVAQLGAVIGREFTYEVIRSVSTLSDEQLQRALMQLVDAELLFQKGIPPQATYYFKHALIRDTAYQSLLKSRRQQYHQKIAVMLETQFPQYIDTQPELIARHYSAAGLNESAIPYWDVAGKKAIERSANAEATSHFSRGIDLLEHLPQGPRRDELEMRLRTSLGVALIMTKGYAAPEVSQHFMRAFELSDKLGLSDTFYPVLFGLFAAHFVRCELSTAQILAGQLLELAGRSDDEDLLLASHLAAGCVHSVLGNPTVALDYLRGVNQHYDIERHKYMANQYGQDIGATAMTYEAYDLWALGLSEQALDCCRRAMLLAHRVDHPHTLGLVLSFAADMHAICGLDDQVEELAEELNQLSETHGFQHWRLDALKFKAWLAAGRGQHEQAANLLQQINTALLAVGIDQDLPYHDTMIAETYARIGHLQEAIDRLTRGITSIERRGEAWWVTAELYRMKAEYLHQQGRPTGEVETLLLESLEEARRRESLAWQLRTACSLARLWKSSDRGREAFELLSPLYDRFTEGYDHRDLREAARLLEDLKEAIVT